jgi:hypothetical protein
MLNLQAQMLKLHAHTSKLRAQIMNLQDHSFKCKSSYGDFESSHDDFTN